MLVLIAAFDRCRKLPKGMKDWAAFIELKKKIDDFNECCPLLEMMANKAMKDRHWLRLEKLLNCPFDVDNDEFTLKNVMEAPLLKYKDDVEVSYNLSYRKYEYILFHCLYLNLQFPISSLFFQKL